MKARLLGSFALGGLIAAALVAFEDKYRRAALAASVAKSGGHQTVMSILIDGFVGTALIATGVVFVLATVLGGRRRRAAIRRQRQDSAQRRPRADAWR
jgi:hypothetical protein